MLHRLELVKHIFGGDTGAISMHEYIVKDSGQTSSDGVATVDLGYTDSRSDEARTTIVRGRLSSTGALSILVIVLLTCSYSNPAYGQACSVPHLPPTETAIEHFADFVHDTASQSSLPLTILTPAVTAAVSQYLFKPVGYGSDGGAYAYHYSLSLLDSVNGKFARDLAFPVLFRQNPHYSRMSGTCTAKERILHVLTHSALTDTGKLNWSSLPASAALAGFSDLYVPDQQKTWSATLTRFATNAAGRMAGEAYEEFCPDMKRAIKFLPCPSKLNVPVASKRDVFRD